MKEEILKLRAEGKTYNQIKEIVGCAKSTIVYHCAIGQKEKRKKRDEKYRNNNMIIKKSQKFQSKSRLLKDKSEDFQRPRILDEGGNNKLGKRNLVFKWQDVVDKFGVKTNCYLTGRPIDLKIDKNYHFDHIVSISKGGNSSLDNLGIACREANLAKSNLSVEELLGLCKEILEFNGYEVNKISSQN